MDSRGQHPPTQAQPRMAPRVGLSKQGCGQATEKMRELSTHLFDWIVGMQESIRISPRQGGQLLRQRLHSENSLEIASWPRTVPSQPLTYRPEIYSKSHRLGIMLGDRTNRLSRRHDIWGVQQYNGRH